MTTDTSTLFSRNRDALFASLAAAMVAHYGDRVTVRPYHNGVHYGIDPKPAKPGETPDAEFPQHDFSYHVRVKPWGRGGEGVLNVEYGKDSYRGREHTRSKKDGTVDVAKIVADCEARRLANIRDRELTVQHNAAQARGEALVAAAGLTTDSRIEVTSYGRVRVSFGLPNTVDPDALRDLMAKARELSLTPEAP